MRYSIYGATLQQVTDAGGTDITEARRIGIIFTMLNDAQANRLRAMGFKVTAVGKVAAGASPPVVLPPRPVTAVPTYSPEELVAAAGYEDLRAATSPPLYGSGFAIAILDTGIRETHEGVGGRVVYSKNYTDSPMGDGYNHGTGVCSIILTVAPLCNVINMKVLDDDGDGTEEGVVLAIDDCIELLETRPDIAPRTINLSLGSPDDGDPDNIMRVACRAAIEAGIWVVAAAGNEGPTPQSVLCPACERLVVAVGSLSFEPFSVSYWSGRGPTVEGLIKPDLVMFGEDVVVAGSGSDTEQVSKSGSSFALPFVTGLSMLYHEGVYRRAMTTRQLVGMPSAELFSVSSEELINTYFPLICVKPEGIVAGKDTDYGYGLPYGPLVIEALRVRPAVDIGTLVAPMIMIGMIGMIMPMMKT